MYSFYLNDFRLPVTPSKLQLKISNQNKTANLINEGEINILKDAGLTEITFDFLLPNMRYPFAVYTDGFKSADYYLDKLEKLKTGKKPFQFIVTRKDSRGFFDTNIKVSLEDYTITEDAEKYGFDVFVSVKLKQYKDYCTKVLIVKDNTSSSTGGGNSNAKTTKTASVKQSRTSNQKIPNTYKVKKGDTLWSIAKRYYDDGNRYTEIVKLNNLKNANLIKEGQVLKLV